MLGLANRGRARCINNLIDSTDFLAVMTLDSVIYRPDEDTKGETPVGSRNVGDGPTRSRRRAVMD